MPLRRVGRILRHCRRRWGRAQISGPQCNDRVSTALYDFLPSTPASVGGMTVAFMWHCTIVSTASP